MLQKHEESFNDSWHDIKMLRRSRTCKLYTHKMIIITNKQLISERLGTYNHGSWAQYCSKFKITYTLMIHSYFRLLWAPSQYPKRRLSVRSRKVSKPRDLYLELSDRSDIWQSLRQQCCRCACQISKRYDNLKSQSRGFETLRDLTKRRLFGYWDGALVVIFRNITCPNRGLSGIEIKAWMSNDISNRNNI